jgi:acyl carrier protein
MAMEGMVTEFIQKDLVRAKVSVRIDPGYNLIESGVVDSLGILKLIAFLESRFSIEISDDEVLPENFETVAAICSFLHRKANKAQA